MGKNYTRDAFSLLDLSSSNSQLNSNSIESLEKYIEHQVSSKNAKLGYGGYAEKRQLYTRSALFESNETRRDIHLAIDVWSPSGTPVYAPLDGRIHSFANNDTFLDYGYTLILQHSIAGLTFYTLYGHLGAEHFHHYQVNKAISKGDLIASLGSTSENGGWSPHIHFQLIIDIGEYLGDYPGVCSENDRSFYLENCPDPTCFVLPK